MWNALLFGAVSSSALLIGAVIGVRFRIPKRLLAMLLAFAAGALITALSFELFGRLNNSVSDYPEYFDFQLTAMAKYLGLGPA